MDLEGADFIYSRLFHKHPDAIFVIEDNIIVDCNEAALIVFGYNEKSHLIGLRPYELSPLHQNDGQSSRQKGEKAIRNAYEKDSGRFLWTHMKSDGEEFETEIILISEMVDDKKIIIAIVKDITDKTKILNKFLKQKTNFEQLFNSFPNAVAVINNALFILDINKSFEELFQFSSSEIIERSLDELLSLDFFETHLWSLPEKISNQEIVSDARAICRRKNGSLVDISFSMYPIIHNKIHMGNYVVCTDITELRKRDEKIRFLSYRDNLTGLYNKDYFIKHTRDQLAHLDSIKDSNENMGVLLLDINDFSSINDNLGYDVGDIFLKRMAKRLKTHLGNKGFVSKFGGDEFIILVYNVESRRQLTRLGKDILNIFDKPFKINDYDFYVTCSIGISMYPNHGNDSHDLIKSADIALNKAKEYKGNKVVMYNDKLNQEVTEKFLLDRHLRYAIDNNELYLNYQPILKTETEEIIGVEALVRWQSSELGHIPPYKFIPIAEGNGLILPMGKWILENACVQLKKWKDAGYKRIFLSINISIKQLEQKDFADYVIDVIKRLELNLEDLVLEITESVYMENLESIYRNLKKLNSLGIQISIDDFGTGYSSLGKLSKLEISKLKIDKSFIRELHNNSNNAKIVTAIISMAKSLNLSIVAEGVEEREHIVFLKNAGCDMLQGFLFSKPIAPEEINKLLNKESLG